MNSAERSAAIEKARIVSEKVGTSNWEGNPSLGNRLDPFRARMIRERLKEVSSKLSAENERDFECVQALSDMFDQGVGQARNIIFTKIEGGIRYVGPTGWLGDKGYMRFIGAATKGSRGLEEFESERKRRVQEMFEKRNKAK